MAQMATAISALLQVLHKALVSRTMHTLTQHVPVCDARLMCRSAAFLGALIGGWAAMDIMAQQFSYIHTPDR